MSEESPKIPTGGIGFPGILTIVFVLLKAFEVVDWSWWIVFSPLLVLACFVGLCLAFACFCFFMSRR